MTAQNVVADIILEDQIADLWTDYACLYDVRSPDFKNRDLRESCIQEIAEKVGKTAEWMKAKLKALRNSCVKAKKPAASGSARKNPSKRTIWLLEKLQFLAPHVATRASVSTLNSESSNTPTSEISLNEVASEDDEDDEDVEELNVNDTNPVSPVNTKMEVRGAARSTNQLIKRPSTSRKRQADEEFMLIRGLSQSIADKHKRKKVATQGNSILQSFANYIANALSELDSKTCHLAQHKINNIIFQAQAGLLVPEVQSPMMWSPAQHAFLPVPQAHHVIPTGITTSSPQSMLYTEHNSINSSFLDEQSRVNPTGGW